ncbi:MAG: IucA/IucC family protein [Enterobacter hormaechei]
MSDERSPEVYFQQRSPRLGLDLRQYAPEYRGRFAWVAVQREHLVWSSDADCEINALLASAMATPERARFDARWQALGLNDGWCRCRCTRGSGSRRLPFISWRSWRAEMVELGEFGDEYLAQQSAHAHQRQPSRPYDIKLPLTIYNTSCYRIRANTLPPGRWPRAGFSNSLHRRHADPLWRAGAWRRCGSVASGLCRIAESAYRYREMLGVIWRESVLLFRRR